LSPALRLNKLLAERVGLARRKCDLAIQEGEVEIDGRIVLEPGTSVDPAVQRVTFRGKALPELPESQHWLYHKPLGVLVTWHDPQGRVTIKDVLPDFGTRLFAVGRLDADTSGLLLLTNDGALAHRLSHPRYEVPKTYRMTVKGRPTEEQLDWLALGVDLGEGEVSSPAVARLVRSERGTSVVELVLAEGKKRQVRRMAKAVGLWLTELSRVAYGPLELGSLAPGSTRTLTREEVRALRAATDSAAHAARKR
jgi:23S rRNA pseudouridine2605 synthase